MNFVVAEICVGDQMKRDCVSFDGRLNVRRDGNTLLFSLEHRSEPLLLRDVRCVMRWVVERNFISSTNLLWRFSSVSANILELGVALRRWDETGEPPLLSFIGLDLGDYRHATRGLAAFIGHEIAAEFDNPSLARHAARNLARLARYALTRGGIRQNETYQATDGAMLTFVEREAASPRQLVTIVFQSVRNGSALG